MLKYSITIKYDSNDEIYVADCLELLGCMAHGNTPEEALKEIQIAINGWLEVAAESGMDIPEPFEHAS